MSARVCCFLEVTATWCPPDPLTDGMWYLLAVSSRDVLGVERQADFFSSSRCLSQRSSFSKLFCCSLLISSVVLWWRLSCSTFKLVIIWTLCLSETWLLSQSPAAGCQPTVSQCWLQFNPHGWSRPVCLGEGCSSASPLGAQQWTSHGWMF